MTELCAACRLLDCECPTHWELYAVEGDCRVQEWSERANARGFAVGCWLKALYADSDRLQAIATRASPMMRVFAAGGLRVTPDAVRDPAEARAETATALVADAQARLAVARADGLRFLAEEPVGLGLVPADDQQSEPPL